MSAGPTHAPSSPPTTSTKQPSVPVLLLYGKRLNRIVVRLWRALQKGLPESLQTLVCDESIHTRPSACQWQCQCGLWSCRRHRLLDVVVPPTRCRSCLRSHRLKVAAGNAEERTCPTWGVSTDMVFKHLYVAYSRVPSEACLRCFLSSSSRVLDSDNSITVCLNYCFISEVDTYGHRGGKIWLSFTRPSTCMHLTAVFTLYPMPDHQRVCTWPLCLLCIRCPSSSENLQEQLVQLKIQWREKTVEGRCK